MTKTKLQTSSNISNKAFVVMAIGFALLTLITSSSVNSMGHSNLLGLTPLLLVVIFTVWHGIQRYGLKSITVFFLVAQVVSNIMENLSIATGFPFGDYYYMSGSVPFIFQVPVVIGIAYFAYGYLAWTVANILLGKVDKHIRSWAYTLVLPLTATFIMVMWDVVMDPINSTIRHTWVWENGGGFNGVPLSNYLGWFLTVYLFYQIFALYLRKRTDSIRVQIGKAFWVTPVILYLVTGLSFMLMYVFVSPGAVTDATGQVWDKRSIYETAAIMSLYTMTFPAFLAIVKLLRPESSTSLK